MVHAPNLVQSMIWSKALHPCSGNEARQWTSPIFLSIFVSHKSLMSYQLWCWNKLFMISWKRKTSYLSKDLFLWQQLAILSGIFSLCYETSQSCECWNCGTSANAPELSKWRDCIQDEIKTVDLAVGKWDMSQSVLPLKCANAQYHQIICAVRSHSHALATFQNIGKATNVSSV